jgi:hypothetical protein
LSAIPSHAEDLYAENVGLLAISLKGHQVTAGMMCVGLESDRMNYRGGASKCEKFAMPDSNMSRRSSVSILNPDVLAFDVTWWPRQAIVELASRLQLMADPLNFDFSRVRLAGLDVRRIEESEDEESLSPPTFAFSSGCYLLMIAPGAMATSGS